MADGLPTKDECLKHEPRQARRNWLDNEGMSKSMPEYLVPGRCAEDDIVDLQRRLRFLKQNHLDSMILPPPSKFVSDSNFSTDLKRSRSSVPFCSGAVNFPRNELHNDAALRRSSDPCSWASIPMNHMDEDSQLRRTPSLVAMWESLMTKSAAESAEAAENDCPTVAHPLSIADAESSSRVQPPSCRSAVRA
jgi:hypothetical protein